jgi:hypothetical protein
MMDVAKEKGADVKLLSVKDAGHSFHGKRIAPSIEEINETSAKFLISQLTGDESSLHSSTPSTQKSSHE